ncbi:protein sprint isoform X1 [Hyalella azteca]|uniref:Protein sprint isoform X1 n=2 Tax=Hyalella azteca TaxID=294128 RepID=A0A979FK65_HYAAZ|nr:protein sprint isoform X1 [Hyalella azteca]
MADSHNFQPPDNPSSPHFPRPQSSSSRSSKPRSSIGSTSSRSSHSRSSSAGSIGANRGSIIRSSSIGSKSSNSSGGSIWCDRSDSVGGSQNSKNESFDVDGNRRRAHCADVVIDCSGNLDNQGDKEAIPNKRIDPDLKNRAFLYPVNLNHHQGIRGGVPINRNYLKNKDSEVNPRTLVDKNPRSGQYLIESELNVLPAETFGFDHSPACACKSCRTRDHGIVSPTLRHLQHHLLSPSSITNRRTTNTIFDPTLVVNDNFILGTVLDTSPDNHHSHVGSSSSFRPTFPSVYRNPRDIHQDGRDGVSFERESVRLSTKFATGATTFSSTADETQGFARTVYATTAKGTKLGNKTAKLKHFPRKFGSEDTTRTFITVSEHSEQSPQADHSTTTSASATTAARQTKETGGFKYFSRPIGVGDSKPNDRCGRQRNFIVSGDQSFNNNPGLHLKVFPSDFPPDCPESLDDFPLTNACQNDRVLRLSRHRSCACQSTVINNSESCPFNLHTSYSNTNITHSCASPHISEYSCRTTRCSGNNCFGSKPVSRDSLVVVGSSCSAESNIAYFDYKKLSEEVSVMSYSNSNCITASTNATSLSTTDHFSPQVHPDQYSHNSSQFQKPEISSLMSENELAAQTISNRIQNIQPLAEKDLGLLLQKPSDRIHHYQSHAENHSEYRRQVSDICLEPPLYKQQLVVKLQPHQPQPKQNRPMLREERCAMLRTSPCCDVRNVGYATDVGAACDTDLGEDSGSSQASGGSSGSSSGGSFAPCEISLEERLLQAAPIWYLPDLHRLGAVHLLQAQRVGSFIVRQSSKPNTLAITVRLPPNKGPHIEHYLIEVHHSNNNKQTDKNLNQQTNHEHDLLDILNTSREPSDPAKLTTSDVKDVTNNSCTVKSSSTSSSTSSSNVVTYSLEASENRFESVSALIARYAACCDELPVQLRLPARLEEARSRKELHSLALLGQEYWRTVGSVHSSAVSGSAHADQPRPPQPSALSHSDSFNRPAEQSSVLFSSFGKREKSASNGDLLSPLLCTSETSPLPSLVSLQSAGGGLVPDLNTLDHPENKSRIQPPQPLDRSSLHLNLAPLDEILKEPPTFLSFKGGSQNSTPVSKPQPPPRVSPSNMSAVYTPSLIHPPALVHTPTIAHTPTLTTTGLLQSPTIVHLQSLGGILSPTSGGPPSRFGFTKGTKTSGNPPLPPPRWSKSTIATANPTGTITTTLFFPLNMAKETPGQVPSSVQLAAEDNSPNDVGSQKRVHEVMESCELLHQVSKTKHITCVQKQIEVSSHVVSCLPQPVFESSGHCPGSSRNRDQLDLRIRQNFASPQSTPCTPCNPTTPLSTPMSEEGGESRAKLRRSHKDRRRYSNHYHDVNVIDNLQCYRSSLADKISDYEDLWSSPPREIPSSPTSKECTSPKKMSRKSSFKPNTEISKSLGDLSDVSQTKSSIFACDDMDDVRRRTEANGNSFDSIPFRNTNSPFYVEPADCIRDEEKRARIKKTPSNRILARRVANRYSDSNIQWKSKQNAKFVSKIDTCENMNGFSSSAENILLAVDKENRDDLMLRKPSKNVRGSRSKPVVPPKVSADSLSPGTSDDANVNNRPPWRLDYSWRYQPCEVDDNGSKNANSGSPSSDARFPLLETHGECDSLIVGEKTVIDLITEKLPDLPMPDTQSISLSAVTKLSEYDNVAGRYCGSRSNNNNKKDSNMNYQAKTPSPVAPCLSSSISDSGTEFSEPWDSRKWDSLLQTDDESSIEPISLSGTPARPQLADWERRISAERNQANRESGAGSEEDCGSVTGMPVFALPQNRIMDSSIRSKILSPQLLALRHRKDAESGNAIREYSLQLGSDKSSMFAQNIEQFIKCTLETSEKDPEVVVRNVRQFMSGMKNYLVTSGEKQFEDIVKKERSNLKATEFLNMDAILEDVLVRLVLRRLWHHITTLYVNAYSANDSIQRLANNMTLARALQPVKLGIRAGLLPPKGAVLEQLKRLLVKMQRVYAPREKLELLLTTISLIYHTLSETSVPFTGDADDLVPMIMWVLSHTGFFSAEIEADYMSGLLLTSASCGEAKYYLTAFHSAIHSLKHLAPSPDSTPGNSLDSVKQDISVISEPGTLKIVVPDEKNGSIVTRTLPVRPTTTTREVCKMMAHKMRVTNPQDYGLYKLVDGYGEYCESVLGDNECPQSVRNELSHSGHHCIIAFKRTDAKIAWPMVKE